MHTSDGVTLVGTTPDEWVRDLHKMSRTPAATDKDFMTEAAKRAFEETGVHVSDATAAAFVRGLVAAGLLIEDGPVRKPDDGEQRDG